MHDFPGPRLVPVQASETSENEDEPASVTRRLPVALPPEFLSVNCWESVWPAVLEDLKDSRGNPDSLNSPASILPSWDSTSTWGREDRLGGIRQP